MDSLVSNVRSVVKGLEALKNQHSATLNSLLQNREKIQKELKENDDNTLPDYSAIVIDEKIMILKNSLEIIEVGLDDAQVLIQLASHANTVETENAKSKSQVQRLIQESTYLNGELVKSKDKCISGEIKNVQLEEENKDLKFKLELKGYDGEDVGTSQAMVGDPGTPKITGIEKKSL